MQGLLNNLTDGVARVNPAEGYSVALSLLFFLPAVIAFPRGHPRRWAIARRLVELHGGKLQVGGPKADEAHIILTLPAERLL